MVIIELTVANTELYIILMKLQSVCILLEKGTMVTHTSSYSVNFNELI